jgi:predicted hydrocarbon binding protein
MEEKTVADGTVRILMDATEEVIGINGLKALLNYAMMSSLIENRPGYGYEKTFTDIEFSRIIVSFYELLGVPGAKAIFRMIGKAIAKHARDLGFFDSFKELPPRDRLFKSIELYTIASGRGKVTIEGDTIVFDNDACTTCFNLKSDVPICTIISGFINELAAWAGLAGVMAVEKKCKAMGDATCLYEVLPIGR